MIGMIDLMVSFVCGWVTMAALSMWYVSILSYVEKRIKKTKNKYPCYHVDSTESQREAN